MFEKIRRFLAADPFERRYFLANLRARWVGRLVYRRRLGHFGSRVILKSPAQIVGARTIRIHDAARIEPGAILYSVQSYAGRPCEGSIVIGKGVYANRNLNISAGAPIVIGDRVTIATNVFISNYDHGYEDPATAINDQPLVVHGKISIGEDSWLGANVCVLGNVHIGSHVVIGANSVVTADIPSYSVAVGSPARVVRQYDPQEKVWRRAKA